MTAKDLIAGIKAALTVGTVTADIVAVEARWQEALDGSRSGRPLAELLLAECDDCDRRSSVRRVKAAEFRRDKWLGDFDFDANANINPATIKENNSIAIASNESFSGWTRTFADPRLCAAIVDRLTFNGTVIETGTDSYRLANTRQQRAPLQT